VNKILVIALIATLLLTACSESDTSGGVTMEEQSGSGTEANKPFPDAVCPDGSAQYKCGWITGSEEDENSYYIKPGVDLSHSTLSYADLRYASLGLAHLSNADLSNADLSNADLSNADLRNAILSYANLVGANLAGANLAGTNLAGVGLKDLNLSYADLSYTYLSGADLMLAKADSSTTCPNGKPWGIGGSGNCPF
jgi:hypothetical protein